VLSDGERAGCGSESREGRGVFGGFAVGRVKECEIGGVIGEEHGGAAAHDGGFAGDAERAQIFAKDGQGGRVSFDEDDVFRTAAEGLERYLHTKYVGQKRFSLEGGDSFVALLDDLIQTSGAAGIEEAVIGMAHRGRLNVLVNLLGKSPSVLFSEFEGVYDLKKLKGSGDVKYHKGFSADLKTSSGNVHTVLAFNPSHLEVVNPVVEGSVRARQERPTGALVRRCSEGRRA